MHWTRRIYVALSFYFSYRGGVDSDGRPVMVVVGAHFLLRCLDLERFVLYVVTVKRLPLASIDAVCFAFNFCIV